MAKYSIAKTAIKIIILAIIASIVAFAICELFSVESNMQLDASSSLPKWIIIPGYSRKDLAIEMTIYTRGDVKIIVRGPAPESKMLLEKRGSFRLHPLTESKNRRGMTYPNYGIITVDGVDEVFEQREPGKILHVCNDPQIISGYIK